MLPKPGTFLSFAKADVSGHNSKGCKVPHSCCSPVTLDRLLCRTKRPVAAPAASSVNLPRKLLRRAVCRLTPVPLSACGNFGIAVIHARRSKSAALVRPLAAGKPLLHSAAVGRRFAEPNDRSGDLTARQSQEQGVLWPEWAKAL